MKKFFIIIVSTVMLAFSVVFSACDKTPYFIMLYDGDTVITTVLTDDDGKVTLPSPEKQGYTFDGWYYNKALTNKYSPNDVFNKSGTLYCGYIGLEYKVTLDVNGGEALSQSEYIISSGSSVNVLPIPTRKYYNFIGWSIDGSEEISPVFNYAKDVTLKAIWRNKTSTITYDSAGGIIYNGETPIVGNYSTQTVTHGTEFIPYVAKKDGYTFLGWKVSDTEILSGGIWDYDGNLSVTAMYESN